MATNNTKKKTTKKRTSSSKATASKRKTAAAKPDNALLREIIILMAIAFSIILFIANFGVGGVIGKAISSFFFGLFGLFAYIFPLVAIGVVLLAFSNRHNAVVRIKLITAGVVTIFVCALVQLISGNHAAEWGFGQYYLQSAAHKNGGGFFGGFICKLFCMGFGTVVSKQNSRLFLQVKRDMKLFLLIMWDV